MTTDFKLIRLYPNGQRKQDHPTFNELADQIGYNMTHRFGCAMFLDGLCIYKGLSIPDDQLKKFSETLLEEMKPKLKPPRKGPQPK